MLAKTLRRVAHALGYEVARVASRREAPPVGFSLTDLLVFDRTVEPIPGMVTMAAGELLYALCATQEMLGDVLEIGSWQGRSTSYLARAVRDSGNGHVYAVDHFKGNIGRESLYAIGRGLPHLQEQMEQNIRSLGLAHVVTVVPKNSEEARKQVHGREFRFLFIDGDHSEEGVTKDIALFCPLIARGGLVVFDDFDTTFPGVIRSAERWILESKPRVVFSRDNLLVCKL